MFRLFKVKFRGRRIWALSLVGVTTLAAAATLAYAAIPDASGVIHGCYNTRTGALRVVDSEAGQACLPSETSLNWNQQGPQGLPGTQGPPGSSGPRAYAQVGYFGTLITSRSSNVTDVQLVEGPAYCIAVPFTPVHVQATLEFGPAVGVQASIHSFGGCPAGYDIAVEAVNGNDVSINSGFWIAIY